MRTKQDVVNEMLAAWRDPDPLGRHAVDARYQEPPPVKKSRRPRVTPEEADEMRRMLAAGHTRKYIAEEFGVPRRTVYRHTVGLER